MEFFTIAEAARRIAARQLSPVELAEHCLRRIAAEDGTLNSFILLTPERAMADARAAEERVMGGRSRGRLDGIPIGHKDIYGTAGIATTGHSKLLQELGAGRGRDDGRDAGRGGDGDAGQAGDA